MAEPNDVLADLLLQAKGLLSTFILYVDHFNIDPEATKITISIAGEPPMTVVTLAQQIANVRTAIAKAEGK